MLQTLKVLTCGVVLCLSLLSGAVQAASLSAQSDYCVGSYGDIANPTRNCGYIIPANGGVTSPGGPAESGFKFPFFQDQYDKELAAEVFVEQHYGSFHGYASMYRLDPDPVFASDYYQANGSGTFTDTWTINSPLFGYGRLNPTFTVTGGTTASSNAYAYMTVIAELADSGGPLSLGVAPQILTGGEYSLISGDPAGGLRFRYNVPFTIVVTFRLSTGGGYNLPEAPNFFGVNAIAEFQHTATLTGLGVTDFSGNPLTDFTLTTESGTQYPLQAPLVPSDVPEPSTFGMVGVAALALGRHFLAGRRSRES